MVITFNYTAPFIKSIGELAKVKPLFPYFHLDQPICSRIIALGIRSRPRKTQEIKRRDRSFLQNFVYSQCISENITFKLDPIKNSGQAYSLLIAKACT